MDIKELLKPQCDMNCNQTTRDGHLQGCNALDGKNINRQMEIKLREIVEILPAIKEIIETDIEGFGSEKCGWLLEKIEKWEG